MTTHKTVAQRPLLLYGFFTAEVAEERGGIG